MKAIEILEGFNRFFEEYYPNRGYFITRTVIESSKLSKLYKTYKLELWFTEGKHKELVTTIERSARVPDTMDETIVRGLNIELTHYMFKNYSKLLEYGVQ